MSVTKNYTATIIENTEAECKASMDSLMEIKKNLTHDQLKKLAKATNDKSKVAMAMRFL